MILLRLSTLQRALGIRGKVRTNGFFQQERGYKNFGHKRQVTPRISVIFGSFMFLTCFGSLIDWRWLRMMYLHYTGQLVEKDEQGGISKAVQHSVKSS